MDSGPFIRREDLGRDRSIGKTQELCLRYVYLNMFKIDFSSEDMHVSYGENVTGRDINLRVIRTCMVF